MTKHKIGLRDILEWAKKDMKNHNGDVLAVLLTKDENGKETLRLQFWGWAIILSDDKKWYYEDTTGG